MVSRFGRYELLRLLGTGGMAEVFVARQRGPGGFEKRVVIKRVLPELAQQSRFLRLFFEEARLHAGLSHGNLVAIFDFGRVGNHYFLALELVQGCDLGHLLRELADRRLSPELVAYVGAEICHALQHVHRHGLVHRDVTPRNVLLSLDGEVKLADFGVARSAREAGGVHGTIAYMAPEQARGEAADARSDLYSLGLIVAEAATGARVRERARTASEVEALRRASGTTCVSIEGPFAELVAKATAALPEDRFADAEEMARAFELVSAQLACPRADAVRALAALVRANAPAITTGETGEVEIASAPGPATYYRESTTAASFVDEILADNRVAVAPSPKYWRLLPLVVITAALAGVALARRSNKTVAPLHAATAPPPPVVVAAPHPPDVVASSAPAMVAPVRREASLSTLDVVCEPWCFLSVDGERRGEDGRHHVVHVPTGRHNVIVERLTDRQNRVVTLTSKPAQLRFNFD